MRASWLNKKIIIFLFFVSFLLAMAWTAVSLEILPGAFKDAEKATPAVTKLESALILKADYQITTNKPTIIWPKESLLEQGRAGYFYAANPVVSVVPVLETQDLISGDLSGTMQSWAQLQALNEKGEIYWSYRFIQAHEEPVYLVVNSNAKQQISEFRGTPISVDISAAYEQLERISEELSFKRAVFELALQSDVNLSGLVNEVNTQRQIENSFVLTLGQECFNLPTSDESVTSITLDTGDTIPTSTQKPLLQRLTENRLLLLLDSVLFAILLYIIILRKKRLEPLEKEHRRFKEWITEGSIQIQDMIRINVHSLEGLVDLAIDLDKRVIYDPETRKYYVLEENLVYIFDYEKERSKTNMNTSRIGRLMLEREVIHSEQLEMGLFYQQRSGQPLGESLMSLGFIDEITLTSTLAAQAKLPYLELNPAQIQIDPKLLKKMTPNQARALSAIPLGIRKDGKLVIACAETFREGFQKALQEIFKAELFIVAVRPSVVHKLIEQMEPASQVQPEKGMSIGKFFSHVYVSIEEHTRFVSSYYQGNLDLELFLKATGRIESSILAGKPDSVCLLPWLVNHSHIDGDTANLVSGIRRAVQMMDRQLRQNRKLPELLEILRLAGYLTSANVKWLSQESGSLGIPPESILIENYLATPDTIKKAILLLYTLEGFLVNHPQEENLEICLV